MIYFVEETHKKAESDFDQYSPKLSAVQANKCGTDKN